MAKSLRKQAQQLRLEEAIERLLESQQRYLARKRALLVGVLTEPSSPPPAASSASSKEQLEQSDAKPAKPRGPAKAAR